MKLEGWIQVNSDFIRVSEIVAISADDDDSVIELKNGTTFTVENTEPKEIYDAIKNEASNTPRKKVDDAKVIDIF